MSRIFLLLLLSAACAFAQRPEYDDLSAGIALGGPDVLATIKNAEKVTAQRVDSIPEEEGGKLGGTENGPQLKILGEPFAVSPDQAKELKAIFCAGKTYVAPSKACHFRANVRYGFITPTDKIEIVLCFGCGEMDVRRGEKLVSFGPFDGGYGALLAITKKLFPDDRFFDDFTEQKFLERVEKMHEAAPTAKP